MAKISTGVANVKKKAAVDLVAAKKLPPRKAGATVKAAAPAAVGRAERTKPASGKMATQKLPVKPVAAKVPDPKKAAPRGAVSGKLSPRLASSNVVSSKRAPITSARTKPAPPKAVARPSIRVSAAKTAATKIVTQMAPLKKPMERRAKAKPTGTVPAARRAPAPVAANRARPPASHPTAAQSFTVSHLDEADFKTEGLRSYALYRDLGIAAATAGLCQAHVIRFVPPCTDEVRKPHLHHVDLQLVYVLKGWMKNEFDGVGAQMMSTGSCWLQPAGVRHTVLDYSADCEVLEIILPADFKTEEVG